MVASARRWGAVAALTLSAAALSVVFALPAHADEQECRGVFAEQGFTGPDFDEACAAGARGEMEECLASALGAQVNPTTALKACVQAVQP